MLALTIPGRETLALEHLVCDVNGTLAEDGFLIDGVAGRLAQLAATLTIHLLTADTYGTMTDIVEQIRQAALSVDATSPQAHRVETGADKARYVGELAAHSVVAIGNGANDEAMFQRAALSIGVIAGEGACVRTLLATQIIATSPLDALDLLLTPKRLIATLRT